MLHAYMVRNHLPLPNDLMVRKRTHLEDDSLSEGVEDISEDVIEPFAKKGRSEKVPWISKYEPTMVEDVCINPRKMKEIREILTRMLSGTLSTRVLVLSGPAGCSKSTLAKAIARDFFRVKYGSKQTSNTERPYLVEYIDSSLEDVRQPGHFQDFMDGCRYRTGLNLAMVFVEDLPNVFHEETLKAFRNCLRDWIHTDADLPPVVLCLTEVEIAADQSRGYYNIENNLSVETLLGRDLLNVGIATGTIERVKLLPIAKTYMKKALSKIIAAEKVRRSTDFEEYLGTLCESGDIRALICGLEFWHRSPGLAMLARESQITLFHAVGKVIHSSTKVETDADFSADYWSIKSVADTYNNFALLHLALLENYHIYNGQQYDVDVAANIVDSLSINDTLGMVEEYEDYAIRAVRAQLRDVALKTSKVHPMKFPRHFKLVREANKVQREVRDYMRHIGRLRVLFLDVNLVDGCLLPRIYNSFRYKMIHGRKPYSYNRLGGALQEIHADDSLPVMEHELEVARGVRDQFAEDIMAEMKVEDSEDEAMSEEIDETDAETDFDDTLDEGLLRATQRPDDDFLDDPELDMLVSQGRL